MRLQRFLPAKLSNSAERRVGARLSQGPGVVGSTVNRFRFPCGGRAAAAAIRSPLAPRLPPDRVFQDRNMALTWSNGAPGRIRARDPLLRRPSWSAALPAWSQVGDR